MIKADALKAYRLARKTATAEQLLAGVRTYALMMAGEEKQFVKLAGGWLRAGRWDDKYDEPFSASPKPDRVRMQFCLKHDGYPIPCARCERDAEIPEGNEF